MENNLEFRPHFNLQNGEKCFMIDGKIIISEQTRILSDQFTHNDGKVKDIRKTRTLLNILITIAIFSIVFYSQIYPLLLLMFLVYWDLNQLNRYKHPISNTNCLEIDQIEKVSIRRGALNFNYLDLLFKTSEGKLALRPLKIYDSQDEYLTAVTSFKSVGLIKVTDIPSTPDETINGDIIKLNNRTEVVLSDNGLYFTSDGNFDSHQKDQYLMRNFIVYVMTGVFVYLIISKFILMFMNGWGAVDITLLALLFLSITVPLKFRNRSSANFISFESIQSFQRKGNAQFIVKFKSGKLTLVRMFPVLYFKDLTVLEDHLSDKTKTN